MNARKPFTFSFLLIRQNTGKQQFFAGKLDYRVDSLNNWIAFKQYKHPYWLSLYATQQPDVAFTSLQYGIDFTSTSSRFGHDNQHTEQQTDCVQARNYQRAPLRCGHCCITVSYLVRQFQCIAKF